MFVFKRSDLACRSTWSQSALWKHGTILWVQAPAAAASRKGKVTCVLRYPVARTLSLDSQTYTHTCIIFSLQRRLGARRRRRRRQQVRGSRAAGELRSSTHTCGPTDDFLSWFVDCGCRCHRARSIAIPSPASGPFADRRRAERHKTPLAERAARREKLITPARRARLLCRCWRRRD